MRESRRILLVEDDVEGAAALAQCLALAGHDVRVAHGGGEAEQLLGAFEPEVVILDLNLPEIDGWSLARRLRSNPAFGKLPLLVALSGYSGDEHVRRSREAGFDHHIPKPVTPQLILDLVRSVPPPATSASE